MKANKDIYKLREVNIFGKVFAKMHTLKEKETRNQ